MKITSKKIITFVGFAVSVSFVLAVFMRFFSDLNITNDVLMVLFLTMMSVLSTIAIGDDLGNCDGKKDGKRIITGKMIIAGTGLFSGTFGIGFLAGSIFF